MKKWILLFIILLCFGCGKNKNEKRYEQIKKDIDEEMNRYMYISSPHCDKERVMMDQNTLIVQAGMDREKLLDVDGNSYCKVTINAYCGETDKWNWDIYLSCKDYEDDGYIDWGH